MASFQRKFHISHALRMIISKHENTLLAKNKTLLEKQLEKQSQILKQTAICEDDVIAYEHNRNKQATKSTHTQPPINMLEIMNRACHFYETMWDMKTRKLRVLRNTKDRSIIRNDIKYVKDKIDKLVEEMTLLIDCQERTASLQTNSFLDDYIDKFIQ